jgi:hypothetical protein
MIAMANDREKKIARRDAEFAGALLVRSIPPSDPGSRPVGSPSGARSARRHPHVGPLSTILVFALSADVKKAGMSGNIKCCVGQSEADNMKEAGNLKEADALHREGAGLEKAAREMQEGKKREEAQRSIINKRITALGKRLSKPLQTVQSLPFFHFAHHCVHWLTQAPLPKDKVIKKELHRTAHEETWAERGKVGP